MGLSQLRHIFWPASDPQDVLGTARRRLLAVLSTAMGILGSLPALAAFNSTVADYPLQTYVGLFGPMLCLAAPFALFWTGRLKLVSAFVLSLGYLLILIPAATMGGSANPVILYYAALPILATFLIGYRTGAIAAVLTIGTIAALYYLRPYLPGLPAGFDETVAARWNMITLSLLVVTVSLVMAVFHREMDKANHQLDTARQAANAGNVAKSQFLANMSHEIRTPMNGILGMAALMRSSDLSDAQRGQVEIIEKSGEMLLTLLDDILDMSKIEAGELQVENISFDLAEIIETVVSLHSLSAEAKGVNFTTDLPEQVYGQFTGDPLRTSQVMNNLVSNAVKFTSKGQVRLSVLVAPESVEFIVQDTGIGISPEKLARLFEPFTQADASTTRIHGGTGLGLSISRQLCDLMGGELNASSVPGVGSRFVARLPLRRTGSQKTAQAA